MKRINYAFLSLFVGSVLMLTNCSSGSGSKENIRQSQVKLFKGLYSGMSPEQISGIIDNDTSITFEGKLFRFYWFLLNKTSGSGLPRYKEFERGIRQNPKILNELYSRLKKK